MILYGAGGHARVVYESLVSSGVEILGIIDDNRKIRIFNGLPVQHGYKEDYLRDTCLILAIGSNQIRFQLTPQIKHTFGKVKDPSAHISSSAKIGQGAMILARSIIQAGSQVGAHTIINSGAIVEHDCVIGDFVHLGPGSVVCGGVTIGKGSMIGANATILPGVKIGSRAIVGAGAVVLDNVASGTRVVGNPAKIIS